MEENYSIVVNAMDIEESQVPDIISAQFAQLTRLESNIRVAKQKADSAQLSAAAAKDKSAGMFKKKEAIESLQTATMDLADAQVSAAEAQQVSFEYQQKLGEITKSLFGLGVYNIANNRKVVREIEMRLKGASEEEISEMARKELMGVIRDLKAQEDMIKKQEELSGHVRSHEKRLREQDEFDAEYSRLMSERVEHEKRQDEVLHEQALKDKEHDLLLAERAKKDIEQDEAIATSIKKGEERDKAIAAGEKKDAEQDIIIQAQAQKDIEHDQAIAAGQKKDAEQDAIIQAQAQKDQEHDRAIALGFEHDEKQDEEIASQHAKDIEHDKAIAELQSKIQKLTDENIGMRQSIELKTNKGLTYFAIGIGAISLILSIVQFFI